MSSPNIKRPRCGLVLRDRGLSKLIPLAGDNPMKRKITRYRGSINANDLPLFAWSNEHNHHRKGPSYAARHLQRTRGCSASVASLYADLAGLPVEDK